MKILIAEDDFTSRRILEVILAKWGYEVISASDGLEAWEQLQRTDAPKLAILDWVMPGIDGDEICRKLRKTESGSATYIILLTARDGKDDIINGLEAGADDYLAKPFDNDELRARIAVGKRVIQLQSVLSEQEKFKGVLELAGAVCHELNQPLQAVSGYSELLMVGVKEDDPIREQLGKIKGQVDRMAKITRKLMGITKYKTKGYLKGNIIDIDEASKKRDDLDGNPEGNTEEWHHGQEKDSGCR